MLAMPATFKHFPIRVASNIDAKQLCRGVLGEWQHERSLNWVNFTKSFTLKFYAVTLCAPTRTNQPLHKFLMRTLTKYLYSLWTLN